jgi:hypothetical protein
MKDDLNYLKLYFSSDITVVSAPKIRTAPFLPSVFTTATGIAKIETTSLQNYSNL